MRNGLLLAAVSGIGIAIGAATCSPLRAEGPVPAGLAGTSPTYGYNPYKICYGPVYAQRELDYLTYQPGVRGLDYGYGIGYWFGFGPPKQYRLLPPTQQTKAMQPRR
jgi:hypothetical protein